MTHTSALNDVSIPVRKIGIKDQYGTYHMEVTEVIRSVNSPAHEVKGWITYNPDKKSSKRPFRMPLQAWNALIESTTSTALPGAAAEEQQGQENN
jgi:hypothetical protein